MTYFVTNPAFVGQDSGKMKAGDAPKEIDIDVSEVDCLMLTFEGKNVSGNWADARVLNWSELK